MRKKYQRENRSIFHTHRTVVTKFATLQRKREIEMGIRILRSLRSWREKIAVVFISRKGRKGHNYNGERAFICAFPHFCAFFFIILRLEIREYIIYILI